MQLDEDICCREEETVNCGFHVLLRRPLIVLDVPLVAAQFLAPYSANVRCWSERSSGPTFGPPYSRQHRPEADVRQVRMALNYIAIQH